MKRFGSISLLCLICVSGMLEFRTQGIAASSTPAPAVAITRLPTLDQNVWPGDFNGDGKTDLVASAKFVSGQPDVLVVALGDGTGTFGTPSSLPSSATSSASATSTATTSWT